MSRKLCPSKLYTGGRKYHKAKRTRGVPRQLLILSMGKGPDYKPVKPKST